MAKEPSRSPKKRDVPAVTRAIAILRFLARSPQPVGVNPMARAMDIVPSTCLHILRVLQDEGMVDFDSVTKRYTIGVGILPLARSALQRNSFSTMIQPRLSELSAEFGVTSIATQVSEPGQMIVVALSQSSFPFRLQVDLGSRFPALISATGRLVAAYGQNDVSGLRADFKKLVWDNPPTFEDWLDQIELARQRGYALDRGSYISGVTVAAVPLLDASGVMTRSLVAIGISDRLEEAEIPRLITAMQTIRSEIENTTIST